MPRSFAIVMEEPHVLDAYVRERLVRVIAIRLHAVIDRYCNALGRRGSDLIEDVPFLLGDTPAESTADGDACSVADQQRVAKIIFEVSPVEYLVSHVAVLSVVIGRHRR